MDEMNSQLAEHRAKYVAELDTLEKSIKEFRAKADAVRRKIDAIDVLVPNDGDDSGGSALAPLVADPVGDDASDDRVFTPVMEYWRPILKTLVELGGRGRREKVMDAVGERMTGTLKPADYGTVGDGTVIRWRNRVAWQASNMRTRGFIRKESPRGIWEITDAGRKWLDDQE